MRCQSSPKFFQSQSVGACIPPMWVVSRKNPLPPLERGAVPPVRGTTPPDGGGSPPRWGGMTKNERIFAQKKFPICNWVKTSPEHFLANSTHIHRPPLRFPSIIYTHCADIVCSQLAISSGPLFPQKKRFVFDPNYFPAVVLTHDALQLQSSIVVHFVSLLSGEHTCLQ